MGINKLILPLAATAFMVFSCSDPSFMMEGEVEGADNENIVLEKAGYNGDWIVMDSMRTSDSGRFSFKEPAPGAPEIYRLRLGDSFLYFPVDSIETLSVKTSKARFGVDYTIEGSELAKRMMEFDSQLKSYAPYSSVPDSARNFKRRVFSRYLMNAKGDILSYYILTKLLPDGRPLFDMSLSEDLRFLTAVATAFREYRPDDPRARMLENLSVEGMRRRNANSGKQVIYQAEEIKVLPIELTDEDNKLVRLQDVVGKGEPTIVVFSMMTLGDAPAFNRELADIYSKGGIKIYQVSLDEDRYAWREAAGNLPWITVFDPKGELSDAAARYNVTEVPTMFLYNAQGELIDRPADMKALRRALGK